MSGANNRTALRDYLARVHEIRATRLGTKETGYYAALDLLFNTVGASLAPKVIAVGGVADQGAGHPDYLLQVETTRDTRASVEVKSPAEEVAVIAQTPQVRKYLDRYGLCLVTNLRDFALVHITNGAIETIMSYSLAPSETLFWRTPMDDLVRTHGERFADFITTVLTWDAAITRPRDLAEALARYAREARHRITHRSDASLQPLREALAQALGLHFTGDQGEHFFRSSLVQTLFYGLFSAWVVWNQRRPNASPDDFRWREAGDYLSLPVMRELFERIATGSTLEMLDIRKPIEWAEATLRRTQWASFSANFDQADAVNYFYEPFLEAYDPDLRDQLGVWYTPREIIAYQVARVDRLLRDELNIPDGLADERVVVLDPATGTGGYLLEVLRVINHTLSESGAGAMRGLRLRDAAINRVFGFEILPAPFVVAHMQVATLLASLSAPLTDKQRAGVYLTNALTGWKEPGEYKQSKLTGWPALQHEAEAAEHVKHDAQILVILGNPPYSLIGVEEDEERDLLAPYYVGLKERFSIQARAINDLYVRFFRLAERQIAETTGQGIVCYISNYSWLDGLSHPVMRERMINAFDTIWIDSLNGDKYKTGKRTPWGTSDQSIFTTDADPRGIQVGTAITTMLRKPHHDAPAAVYWRQFWGKADEKRTALLQSLQNANVPSAVYEPIQTSAAARYVLGRGGSESNYLTWPALDQIFVRQYPGFQSGRDPDLVSIDPEPLREKMQRYFDASLSNDNVAEYVPTLMLDASRYEAKETRRRLLKDSSYLPEHMVRVAYRPFDDRWLYWEPTTKLLDEKRTEFFEQVFPGNLYLSASTKARRGVNLPTIVDKFGARHLQDPYSQYFPLFVYQTKQQRGLFEEQMPEPQGPQPNITPVLLDQLMAAYEADASERNSIAEALFYHVLAVSRAPLYESENEGYLMQDWPRIPIPASRDALAASAALGRRVGDLLRPDLPFTPSPDLRAIAVPTRADGAQLTEADLRVTVRYGGAGKYDPPTTENAAPRPARLWWNELAYWDNVPPEVYAFTIGGYPVIKKWLDYRHIDKLGRPLRLAEVAYVQEVAQRIAALLALGPALDANYSAIKAGALTLSNSDA